MNISEQTVNSRLEKIREELFVLYWNKQILNLSSLNQLRELLSELQNSFENLRAASRRLFSRPSREQILREEAQLTNCLQTLEYNIDLVSRLRAA